jgi:hypothetical protein
MMYARHTVLATLLAAGLVASSRAEVTAHAEARIDWTTFTATWLDTGQPASWHIDYAYASSAADWTGWSPMINWQYDHDAPFHAEVASGAGGAEASSHATAIELAAVSDAWGESAGPLVPPYSGSSQARSLMSIIVDEQPANRMIKFRWNYMLSLAVTAVTPDDQASAMVGVSFDMHSPQGSIQLAALGSSMGGGPGDRRHENSGTQWVTAWTSYDAHAVRYDLSTVSEVHIGVPTSGSTMLLLAAGACMMGRRCRA